MGWLRSAGEGTRYYYVFANLGKGEIALLALEVHMLGHVLVQTLLQKLP